MLQLSDLPIEQVVRHLDESDDGVGADFRIGILDRIPERLVVGAGPAVQFLELLDMGVLLGLLGESARAQEVAVIS